MSKRYSKKRWPFCRRNEKIITVTLHDRIKVITWQFYLALYRRPLQKILRICSKRYWIVQKKKYYHHNDIENKIFCRKIQILLISFLFRHFYDERYPGIFMTNHNKFFFMSIYGNFIKSPELNHKLWHITLHN